MSRIFSILLVIIVFLSISCTVRPKIIAVLPIELKHKVWNEAIKYIGCSYEWGGQSIYNDPNCTVDCSGFVINAYKGALKNSGYYLQFEDSTVEYIYNNFSRKTKIPDKGDLIFMGETSEITHIAIFEKIVENYVYFIDAYSVTGQVGIRKYATDNPKIKSYGEMEVLSNGF